MRPTLRTAPRRVQVRLLRRLSAVAAERRGRAAGDCRTRRHRLLSRSAAAVPSRARTTSRWSKAPSPPPRMPARIREVRDASRYLVTIGACATAGGIQALRNWADCDEFSVTSTPRRSTSAPLATSTAISDHVPVDFELRGCPDQHPATRRQCSRALLHGRRPAVPVAQRLPRLQAPRQRLRHRGPGCAVHGPDHPVRLRRAVPVVRSRLLRLLRTCPSAQPREPDAIS